MYHYRFFMNIYYNIQYHYIPSNFMSRERERGSVAAWLRFIFFTSFKLGDAWTANC